MKLFNQKDQPLKWDMGGKHYSCEPFGPIDLPDHLVEFARLRGLPLEVTPMAPEQRAHVQAERALQEAADAELLKLKEALALSEAAYFTAQKALEDEQSKSTSLANSLQSTEKKLHDAQDRLKRERADRDAIETKMLDMAAQLAEKQSEAKRKPKKQEA